ncbi:unnamed protein product [Spirodela intermedia]|uniref:Uncharacterized protein n=2 Tax=Spirodela intermedia TaxID=51605 RepID=A0A7I8J274_SPIIN|nr:unnamed protein product [Spirodela intermedia]CAA6664237.1 unnamed protein product [Spirodela intermedia]CAA7400783.1 unnamed protein product [Spirodela intermedia]
MPLGERTLAPLWTQGTCSRFCGFRITPLEQMVQAIDVKASMLNVNLSSETNFCDGENL